VAVSKFIVATLSGSAAMLSEAFHSVADTGNELLLLIGFKRSSLPEDAEHPFGHGRELYFWAFVVSISIFAVGGGLSIYQGISRFSQPRGISDARWDYVVLGIAALFEGSSWTVSFRELKRRRRAGESLVQTIHNSKDPSVFTVLIEDSAALIGLAIAFVGIYLSRRLGNPALDAGASILIGVVLVAAAVALARETGGLLLGEAADPATLKSIAEIIRSEKAVRSLGKLLTMQLGPEEVLLVADVEFVPQLGTTELEEAIDRIESRLRSRHPSVKRMYFEAESLSGKPPRQHVA
jgi:cation diffusion facilitator family transporter